MTGALWWSYGGWAVYYEIYLARARVVDALREVGLADALGHAVVHPQLPHRRRHVLPFEMGLYIFQNTI